MTEKNTLVVVTEEINKWDPLGLLEMGAPDDEFQSEISVIIDRIPHLRSAEELAIEIQTVFSKSFSVSFQKDKCTNIANRIWDRIGS